MPYVEHCKFSDLVATAEVHEVRLYLSNILSALEHIHRLGIIHRDVKPSNFLYDRRRKHFALVDFGLAQREEEAMGEVGQRGRKRSAEESDGETAVSPAVSKRARPAVLLPAAGGGLGGRRAVAILRQRGGEGEGVRRSPRKVFSPLAMTMTHDPGEEQEVVSPLASPAGQVVPRQRLGFPPAAGGEMGRPLVRCSPRKVQPALTLGVRGPGGQEAATPSPTLQRRESFTALLEPSLLSQATDQLKTPLLRASLTSHCSSALHPGRAGQTAAPPAPARAPCSCPGTLRVCDSCLALPHLHANRAGTPGFRPPEVLLKSLRQTVAVDLWAVGVILLSFLSRSYPFFRAPDDMTALAEITAIFGTEAVSAAARRYGRVVTVSQVLEPVELGPVCRELSGRAEEPAVRPAHVVTEEALDLARGLLQLDFDKRLSAGRALRHPFVKNIQNGIN